MAVSFIWPGTLPQSPTRNYSESDGVLALRTPMDRGPAKQRRIGVATGKLAVSFYMTDAQVTALETFVKDTIRGVARFGFPHPRTGVQVEVRIVPAGDGELYQIAYVEPNLWQVALSLEVLP